MEIALPLFFITILVALRHVITTNTDVQCADPLSSANNNECNWAPFNPNLGYPNRNKGSGSVPCFNFTRVYAPNTELVTGIMEDAYGLLKTEPFAAFVSSNFTLQGFPDNNSAVDYIMFESPYDVGCQAFVDFGVAGNNFDVQIRFAYTPGGLHSGDNIDQQFNTWLTNMAFPFWQQPGPRGDNPSNPDQYGNEPGYFIHGFLAIQQAVN